MTYGQPFTPAEVGQVVPDSAAASGGIRQGDTIVSIDGRSIDRFEDVQQLVRFNPNVPMTMVVRRDGELVNLRVTPSQVEENDRLGRHKVGQLGIRGSEFADGTDTHTTLFARGSVRGNHSDDQSFDSGEGRRD